MSYHNLIRSDEAEWPTEAKVWATIDLYPPKPVIDRGWWIVLVAALIVLMAIGGLGI